MWEKNYSLSVKQAALSANPAVTLSISAKASAEDQAQVAVSISIDGGDKNAVSEYGFIYVEGKNALENGTKVSYSFADKGESFTETISGLRPENISYSIYPYLKYSDGEEINGEPYEYVHYWKEITKVVDIDGNEYPVFFSGDRYWMGADLKVTKYNDGTGIPNITDNAALEMVHSAIMTTKPKMLPSTELCIISPQPTPARFALKAGLCLLPRNGKISQYPREERRTTMSTEIISLHWALNSRPLNIGPTMSWYITSVFTILPMPN